MFIAKELSYNSPFRDILSAIGDAPTWLVILAVGLAVSLLGIDWDMFKKKE